MLTKEQKIEFDEILTELGVSLDISETQFNAAVASYNAVGSWLTKDDSLLKPYSPKILPQGSIVLGTIIKPIHKDDDLDLDLVCQLSGKNPLWTQKDVKNIVGKQIERHKTLESLLDEEGRRCWTLKYREDSKNEDKYHMDILPAIISYGYSIILEKSLSSNFSNETAEKLAIRITDKKSDDYTWNPDTEDWLKSNPFGYAIWFLNRAEIGFEKSIRLSESIKPVPKFQTKKLPLQRAVQILKRHRDMMFQGDKDKPISAIITTLAGYAYRKEGNVFDTLLGVIDRMEDSIDKNRFDYKRGRYVKYIPNPVNPEENFADKWADNPKKEENFYKWLKAVKLDINGASELRGTFRIKESLSKSFGEDVINLTFNNIGNKARILTEQGINRFDTKLGIIATGANIINPHKFFGNEE